MPGKTPTLEDLQKDLLKTTWRGQDSSVRTVVTEAGSSQIPTDALTIAELPTPSTGAQAMPVEPKVIKAPVYPSVTIIQKQEAGLNTAPTDLKSDYKIRMLQFARAAIFALDYQKLELPAGEKEDRKNEIEDTTKAFLDYLEEKNSHGSFRLSDKALRTECNTFFSLLAQKLDPSLSPKKAEKQLSQAEQLLTWHEGRIQQKNISYITAHGKTLEITRTEEAVRGLTEEQKQAFLNRDDKIWYKTLSPLLKAYIDQHTDAAVKDGNWSALERPIPATLRGIPGLANFVRSTTSITDLTNPTAPKTLCTHSTYHSATPVPIDIKDKAARIRLTVQNIDQYIGHSERLNTLFQSISIEDPATLSVKKKLEKIQSSAETKGEKLSLTLPFNSLLNELMGEAFLPHKDNNSRFIQEIRAAIKQVKAEYEKKYPNIDLDFFETNTPINNFRYLWITRNTERLSDDQRYLDFCDTQIQVLEASSPEGKFLTAAKKALEDLQGKSDYFGDKTLLRAALYELIIPNGLSACKSGKDRQLYKQDYAAALQSYYAAYDHFPNFELPPKMPIALKALGYLGATAAVVAGVFALMMGGIIPLIAIIGLGAGGAALSLVSGAASYFLPKKPNFKTRSDFLSILRPIRLSGFSALSASLNAPGAYGQKNTDIAPSDLSHLRQAQRPFRSKTQLINLALYILGASILAVAAYFLITHLLVLAAPVLLALPILLAIAVAIPIIVNTLAPLVRYFSSPKDKAHKDAIKDFAQALKEDSTLAKLNKLKGGAKPAEVKALERALTDIRDPSAKSLTRSVGSTPLSSGPITPTIEKTLSYSLEQIDKSGIEGILNDPKEGLASTEALFEFTRGENMIGISGDYSQKSKESVRQAVHTLTKDYDAGAKKIILSSSLVYLYAIFIQQVLSKMLSHMRPNSKEIYSMANIRGVGQDIKINWDREESTDKIYCELKISACLLLNPNDRDNIFLKPPDSATLQSIPFPSDNEEWAAREKPPILEGTLRIHLEKDPSKPDAPLKFKVVSCSITNHVQNSLPWTELARQYIEQNSRDSSPASTADGEAKQLHV